MELAHIPLFDTATELMARIMEAFAHWENQTCLTFEAVEGNSSLPHIEVVSLNG